MKIYGVTYDHTINYGSNFQAYTLQRVINGISLHGEPCEYEVIPIIHCKDISSYGSFSMQSIIGKLRKLVSCLVTIPFRNFNKRYMRFAEINYLKDLPQLNEKGDAFICGSDVIWNSRFNYSSGAFYLDFANKYKFSYAASFGKTDLNDKEIEMMKQFLPSFNEISCREKTGCDTVAMYTGREAVTVLDPVLMLNSTEWTGMAREGSHTGKYIFVYATHINETVNGFIKAIADKTGLKVVYSAMGVKMALKLRVFRIYSPERWLQLLHDAEYVVTNSFHATAFCVLFHKKFFTVVHGEKSKGINVRMNDFLSAVGLESRLFSSLPETLDFGEINYENADRALEDMRNGSMEFLRRNLEAAYQQKITREKKEK